MYYDLLARFSALVAILADRLLRRKVVIPTVVLFILALPLGGDLRWISGIVIVALFLLFSLWLASNYVRRTNADPEGSSG
jgi:Ca2+/Na+ antiporter